MFGIFKSSNVKRMSMVDAKNELDNDKSITLVDVRTPAEYSDGHIKGSINIPLDNLASIESKVKDKSTKLFVYCLSGGRSAAACKQLISVGYTDITDIGGISSWPYEVVQ